MRTLWLLFLLLVPFLSLTDAQSHPVLEVYRTKSGMAPRPPGRYLLLLIGIDGNVEYEEQEDGGDLVTQRYQLDGLQFERLKVLLRRVVSKEISESFEPDSPTIDHTDRIDFRIDMDSKAKSIRLTNFAPRLPDDIDKYPGVVVELTCAVKALRRRSDYKMLGTDCIVGRRADSGQ